MASAGEHPGSRGKSFVHNVLWNWVGLFVSLVSGLLLTPFVIRHLGDERYGIWALAFSLVDYYALVDLGFRSAVVKYAAHYRALGDFDKLEELVSTGLAYFTIAAVAVFGGSVVVAHYVTRLFRVAPGDQRVWQFLIVTVGLGFALGVVFETCTAVLEACQRFDLFSRIMMINNGVRVAGCFVVICLGYGLKAMGLCCLAGQLLGYALTYRALRSLFPDRNFSPRKARVSALRQMFGYGVRTCVANTSLIVLNQSAPLLIGHFLSAALAGYFAFPLRLLNYAVDFVGRTGMVTGAKAAELTARRDVKGMARMAVLVNRYSLTLFLPLSVYLVIFGRQLLRVWINPAFAANSAPLLPVLGAGIAIAIAAQYNSTSILYGMAKHGALAWAVSIEAVLGVASLWYVIPRYGLFTTACVVSGLMIASRGLFVPYSVSHHLGMRYTAYLWGIYARPVAIMVPVWVAAWLVNRLIGQPATWPVVLGGGTAMAACYYGLVLYCGLESEHRALLLDWIHRAGAQMRLALRTGQ